MPECPSSNAQRIASYHRLFKGFMQLRTTRVLLIGLFFLAAVQAQTPAAQTSPAQQNQNAPRRPAHTGSTGSVSGSIKDDTGGVIPGAVVTLANESGTVQTVKTKGDGTYVFRGVPPGTYTVSSEFAGLQQQGITAVSVTAGQTASGNIAMTVQAQRQEVTVTDTTANVVSTDPASNASALVLKPEDLDALPDDPDDMEADLQALAGPSAGPGGNQIYIDGFSGGRLPPKESIREIRINSNPFSAEFDKLGYGRIQIFTKPGSDKFHGQGYYNISDGIWNSRNPFLVAPGSANPPFRTQLFGGNVSGPIGKHGSFFVDAERRQIDDNGIITATIPGQNFLTSSPYQNYYSTPQRRTTVSPRVDYQLGSNNTLSFRYSYLENDHILTGISGFNLPGQSINGIAYPSTGYSSSSTEHVVQIVETSVINTKAVNETHFIFDSTRSGDASQSTAPALNVSQSFTSGGSGFSAPGFPSSYGLEHYFELQNYTSVTWGPHTTKFGVRVRATTDDNSTPKNFNGIYSFLGGSAELLGTGFSDTGQKTVVTSIQQYLTTEQLLAAGRSTTQIAALGYGPSKYSVNAGNPYIGANQEDFGPFMQDDWRVKPNLTVSAGFRLETQTNINHHFDWAPRFGFAWSPNARAGGRAKTVIRGGWGIFYDRFGLTSVENALRYNTGGYQTYTLYSPLTYNAAFDTPIDLTNSTAVAIGANQRYQIDSHLQAPRLMQTAIGLERQLAAHTTLSVNFLNSRGIHEFRTVDINAPVPTPGMLPPGATANSNTGSNNTGIRPYGDLAGDIYDYQSTGTLKQTQLIVGANAQVGRAITLFSRYSYNNAHSDTDGLSTLPADPYNLRADWGRSNLDTSHSLFIGGSIAAKWGLRFSPFIVAHTGTPFNISTGTDLYLQGSTTPTARPGIVDSSLSYYGVPGFPGVGQTALTKYYYNATPLVSAPGTSDMIARNAGTGPGFLGVNLRVSKTWGFGTTKFAGASGGASAGGGGGGGGGPRGGGGFGGGGPRGGPGGESSAHRYNLTASLNARNILNHENLNTPNGTITSPYFLYSTGITGGFGAEATASNQRRLDLQLRFTF